MEFGTYWPSWPDRTSSTLVLVDTSSTTVDDLFQLLFGSSSAFQVHLRPIHLQPAVCHVLCHTMTSVCRTTVADSVVLVHFLCTCMLRAALFVWADEAAFGIQARARETRGFTNYSESEWVTATEELPCLPGGFSWTCPAPTNSASLTGTDFQSRMRKARSTLS